MATLVKRAKKGPLKSRIAAARKRIMEPVQPAKLAEAPAPRWAEVLFKELPEGKIIITGFANFFSAADIRAIYGQVVLDIYKEYGHMLLFSGKDETFVAVMGSEDNIRINQVMDQKDFNKLIGEVKKCGARLHKIAHSYVTAPEKSIKI